MVRSEFRLWAGVIFWVTIVTALVINGGIWPLKGFWPLALCATALGALSAYILGIIYWQPLRQLALIPSEKNGNLLVKLKPIAMISLLLSAVLTVRAIAELNT